MPISLPSGPSRPRDPEEPTPFPGQTPQTGEGDPAAPPPADPTPASPAAPGTGGGKVANGTGYISFADYINGNQDQINAERGGLETMAKNRLQGAEDTYNASAAEALKGIPAAERGALDDQYGYDTSKAYQDYQDEVATRAAHPDFNWNTPAGQAPDPNIADTHFAANIPGSGTNNDAKNPYDLTGQKFDAGDIKNRIGGTAAGQKAANDFEALGAAGAQNANLANWGGVFDALKTQNPGAGAAGAGFDATLIGKGLQGTADYGRDAQKAASDKFDADLASQLGKANDQTYGGRDVYQAPPPPPTPDQGAQPVWTGEEGGYQNYGPPTGGSGGASAGTQSQGGDSGGVTGSSGDPNNPWPTENPYGWWGGG